MDYLSPIYNTLIGIIIGALVAGIKSLHSTQKAKSDAVDARMEALVKGMSILLRQTLFDYYDTYQYQQEIPADTWKEIESTHDTYKALGGNSTGDRVYSELQKKHITMR